MPKSFITVQSSVNLKQQPNKLFCVCNLSLSLKKDKIQMVYRSILKKARLNDSVNYMKSSIEPLG